MEKQLSYSIIIPHKNTPELLQRCLDSIPQRDDIEAIVIDDNSDPEKVDFNQFPGNDRKDITIVFDKTNKGAGHARNIGLERVRGQWLLFADADDFFYPNTFDILDKYKGSDNDIIYFYFDARDGVTNELIPDRVPNIKKGIDNKDYNLLRYNSYSPCGKFIRRTFIIEHHINFEEVIAANDVMFSTMVGFYAHKISTISEPLYCATRNCGSLFFSPDVNKIKSRILVASRSNHFLYQHGLQRYRQLGINWVFFFFPKHPLIFIWAIFKMRYEGDNILYLRLLTQKFMDRLRGKFKRLK
jgi:glycosyltransferase involved in cell wall biosynthesis